MTPTIPDSETDLAALIAELGPWRHDIDLGPFSTFDVAETKAPFQDIHHPRDRADFVIEHLPADPGTALDLGTGEGGIAFRLEEVGWDVTGVDVNDDFLRQARVARAVRESDVEFVQADVLEYVLDLPAVDVIVACGLLYHIGSDLGDRNIDGEQTFVRRLLASGADRIIIETNDTRWLDDFIVDSGGTLVDSLGGTMSRQGVRQWAVVDP